MLGIYKFIRLTVLLSGILTILLIGGDNYFNLPPSKQDLIRLHVIANSDSIADQVLKLQVRDAIINEMKKQFTGINSQEEAMIIASKNLHNITKIAREQVTKQNKNYKVAVILDKCLFPTKTYGDITLAAGKYEAVRVIIGSGQGQNWWCVLFPPLCFVDGVQKLEEGETPQGLKVFEQDNIEYRVWSLELLGINN